MVHKVTHQPNLSAALALRAPAVRNLFADAASADTIGRSESKHLARILGLWRSASCPTRHRRNLASASKRLAPSIAFRGMRKPDPTVSVRSAHAFHFPFFDRNP